MAKLSAHGGAVKKLVHLRTGLGIAICRDGHVLKRDLFGRWKLWRKLRKGVDPEEFARGLLENGEWREGVPPSWETLRKWEFDGVAEATDGCRVEPDGECPHGFKSWLLVYGII